MFKTLKLVLKLLILKVNLDQVCLFEKEIKIIMIWYIDIYLRSENKIDIKRGVLNCHFLGFGDKFNNWTNFIYCFGGKILQLYKLCIIFGGKIQQLYKLYKIFGEKFSDCTDTI